MFGDRIEKKKSIKKINKKIAIKRIIRDEMKKKINVIETIAIKRKWNE
jgi:hypothetical protein